MQIAEGIVLTVEPGVKIYDVTQYSNGNIQVWGSFNAIGTTSSTIILNSVNLYSESNSAMITIKIYSELNYTNIYQYYGNLVLEDSEINRPRSVCYPISCIHREKCFFHYSWV